MTRSLERSSHCEQVNDMTPKTQAFESDDSRAKRQYQVFAGLSIVMLGLAELGYLFNQRLFQGYFGDVHPVLVLLLMVFLGATSLAFLISRGLFTVFSNVPARERLIGFALAIGLALVAIFVDVKVRFPASMNVSFPESLIFYPVIGFCVEIIFHLLPLSIVILVFSWVLHQTDRTGMLWISIALVSLIEPIFQVISGLSLKLPDWVPFWTGFHVFAINFTQLIIFKRFGFVWTYLFRLTYYAFWHILWGHFRLQILF